MYLKNKLFILLVITACNSKKLPESKSNKSSGCNDNWIFGSSHVDERVINDTVRQEIVDGKVWFEIISPKDMGNGIIQSYIKNYRMDGSLLSEGYVTYNKHPVVDSKEIGNWKFYDCEGNVIRIQVFK